MDPNIDPRDSTTPRPQVSFTVRIGSDPGWDLFREFGHLKLPYYYDMMLFDPTEAGIPGVVRFEFEAPRNVVDQAAKWLRSLPIVVSVRPFYGGPDGAA